MNNYSRLICVVNQFKIKYLFCHEESGAKKRTSKEETGKEEAKIDEEQL